MTTSGHISFAALIELVEQLPVAQQHVLLARLQRTAPPRELSSAEKLRLLRSVRVETGVLDEPSPRRTDWYDDDGR
jgi:hypothetical protein